MRIDQGSCTRVMPINLRKIVQKFTSEGCGYWTKACIPLPSRRGRCIFRLHLASQCGVFMILPNKLGDLHKSDLERVLVKCRELF